MIHGSLCIFSIILTIRTISSVPIDGAATAGSSISTQGHYKIENNGEYPYMTSLERNDKHLCGATIIKVSIVLTAAHCVLGETISTLQIRAGTYLKNETEGKFVQVRTIKYVIIHPDFDITNKEYSYDIAVIKLMQPFFLRDNVKTINMATPDMEKKFVNKDLTVLGFGRKKEDISSQYLLFAKVKVVKNKFCGKFTGMLVRVQMCTIGYEGDVALLSGDSGGPLVKHVVGKPDKDLLIGVISFSINKLKGQLDPNRPSVYTEIAVLHNWIMEAIDELSPPNSNDQIENPSLCSSCPKKCFF